MQAELSTHFGIPEYDLEAECCRRGSDDRARLARDWMEASSRCQLLAKLWVHEVCAGQSVLQNAKNVQRKFKAEQIEFRSRRKAANQTKDKETVTCITTLVGQCQTEVVTEVLDILKQESPPGDQKQ